MYANLAIIAIFAFLYSAIAGRVDRSMITGPIIFVGFGLIMGPYGFDVLTLSVNDAELRGLADLTLALVLFIDAANANLKVLRGHFKIPGRMLLIGMPGIQRRLERYPQFYSRICFAHHYRTLQGDELTFVLTRHWRKLGITLDEADLDRASATIPEGFADVFGTVRRCFQFVADHTYMHRGQLADTGPHGSGAHLMTTRELLVG